MSKKLSEMSDAEKEKRLEEIAFNKRFNKKMKLSPSVNSLRKDIGKAPKCGVREKPTASVVIATGKKKK